MKIELKSTQRLCVINLLAVFKYYPIQNVFDTNGKGGGRGELRAGEVGISRRMYNYI